MICCSLLNPAIDVLYTVDEFRPGMTVTDAPSRVFPAGKGINVAKVVRILGEEVCVAGLVGEDDVARFSRYLEEAAIGHYLFPVAGAVRINSTVIEKSTGQVAHFNSAGNPLPGRLQEEFTQFIRKQLREGDQWCLTGSIPPGFDASVYADMIRMCRKSHIDTLLDTRGNPLRLGVRAKPLVVKPNSTELEGFFGEQIHGVHHIALKGKRLIDMGIQYVFISLGSDGMIALHENDCLLCSAPQVKSVDTVGCGDALVGGVLVSRKRQFSFPETCRMAIACGASKAMHEGPGVITLDEVWQLMEDVKITSV